MKGSARGYRSPWTAATSTAQLSALRSWRCRPPVSVSVLEIDAIRLIAVRKQERRRGRGRKAGNNKYAKDHFLPRRESG